VKNDPTNERFDIPAVGIGYFVEKGEEVGKMERFEVYLDLGAVFARIGKVAAAAKEEAPT
jgi:hypothetical protein